MPAFILATEIELKLKLDPKDIALLLGHPLLQIPAKRQKLNNIYFDTPELALKSSGIAVRERRILRRNYLTVKLAHRSEGGLSSRSEWEAPSTPGIFDFETLIDDARLAQRMALTSSQLIPIFNTDFVRKSWLLSFKGSVIEVAIDQGKITTQIGGKYVDELLSEVELELKEGDPIALFSLARVLSRNVRLHPSTPSKAERGFNLFLGIPSSPSKPSLIKLDRDASPLESFQKIILDCLNHLQANDDGILKGTDAEYIHQARVAMRRIRSALKLFSVVLPVDFVMHWNSTWRDLANELGDSRNWDVFNNELLPLLSETFPNHSGMTDLIEFSKEKRMLGYDRAKKVIGGRAYCVKLLSFTEAVMNLSKKSMLSKTLKTEDITVSLVKMPVSATTQQFAMRILRRRHQRFIRQLVIRNRNLEQSHQLRLELKKLRYAFDFFTEFFPKGSTSKYLKSIAHAQELLGKMNDLATAEKLLSEKKLQPSDFAYAWLLGRQSGYLSMMPKILASMMKIPPPWKS